VRAPYWRKVIQKSERYKIIPGDNIKLRSLIKDSCQFKTILERREIYDKSMAN
jgi:hypothetical protein